MGGGKGKRIENIRRMRVRSSNASVTDVKAIVLILRAKGGLDRPGKRAQDTTNQGEDGFPFAKDIHIHCWATGFIYAR